MDHFLHKTPKLGIRVEVVQFLLKLFLKRRFLAVQHDFRWLLIATKLLTAKLFSLHVKELEILEKLESESGRRKRMLARLREQNKSLVSAYV